MNILFAPEAWEEYTNWVQDDKIAFKKINALIASIMRDGPLNGIGRPEKLKHVKNTYSRHINHGDRLTYAIDENSNLVIKSCKGHYDDK